MWGAFFCSLRLNPDLKSRSFQGPIYVPFIYNFRTDDIFWVIGSGALSPDGTDHPDATDIRLGVHDEIYRKANPEEDRDWGGGAFLYDPDMERLMFNPVGSVWSIGRNQIHWSECKSCGLLPWQYLDVAMIAAEIKLKIQFGSFNKNIDEEMIVNGLVGHRGFPDGLDQNGRKALTKYLLVAATDPQDVLYQRKEMLSGKNNPKSRCEKILGQLDKSHPTTTPAVLGRGRLGSMILE